MSGLNLLASTMTQICERRLLGEFHLLIEELKHIRLHLDVSQDDGGAVLMYFTGADASSERQSSNMLICLLLFVTQHSRQYVCRPLLLMLMDATFRPHSYCDWWMSSEEWKSRKICLDLKTKSVVFVQRAICILWENACLMPSQHFKK